MNPVLIILFCGIYLFRIYKKHKLSFLSRPVFNRQHIIYKNSVKHFPDVSGGTFISFAIGYFHYPVHYRKLELAHTDKQFFFHYVAIECSVIFTGKIFAGGIIIFGRKLFDKGEHLIYYSLLKINSVIAFPHFPKRFDFCPVITHLGRFCNHGNYHIVFLNNAVDFFGIIKMIFLFFMCCKPQLTHHIEGCVFIVLI